MLTWLNATRRMSIENVSDAGALKSVSFPTFALDWCFSTRAFPLPTHVCHDVKALSAAYVFVICVVNYYTSAVQICLSSTDGMYTFISLFRACYMRVTSRRCKHVPNLVVWRPCYLSIRMCILQCNLVAAVLCNIAAASYQINMPMQPLILDDFQCVPERESHTTVYGGVLLDEVSGCSGCDGVA